MTSQTSSIQEISERKQRDFFIYFDQWSGNISSISNKVRTEITDPYLKTDDPIAGKLMTGIMNIKKYVVAELVDGLKLVEKEDYLRIKAAEEHLTLIDVSPPSVSNDINIVLYLSDYKMEVNISSDLMYQLTGKVHNNEIKLRRDSEYEKVVLYIIEKNNPLHLLETVEIDPVELLQNGYLLFDLGNLRNIVPLGKIQVLTRRIFKSYGLKVKQNYITVDYGLARNRKREHLKIMDPSTPDFALFTIEHTTDGWLFTSNFDNPHEYKIYKDVNLFLTTDDPNRLLDTIRIPYTRIGNRQTHFVRTNIDPRNCKILLGEEGKSITFKFEEI